MHALVEYLPGPGGGGALFTRCTTIPSTPVCRDKSHHVTIDRTIPSGFHVHYPVPFTMHPTCTCILAGRHGDILSGVWEVIHVKENITVKPIKTNWARLTPTPVYYNYVVVYYNYVVTLLYT